MPWEIIFIPAIICFVLGLRDGLDMLSKLDRGRAKSVNPDNYTK